MDPGNQVFDYTVSESTRALFLGLFLMAFSLGQFIGAPILGEYADRHGRRNALLITILFTIGGLALSAWSMQVGHLVGLFIGRLLTGVFAGNMSICLAAVTDLSHTETAKVKNFGYLSVCAGLSFVMGAYVGGKLSDATVNQRFEPDVPLWIATGLTMLNFLYVLWKFNETAKIDESKPFAFFECFKNIGKALLTKRIKRMYLVFFLFLIAWTVLLQFTPLLMVQRFGFTSSNIGDLALYMGLCWAFGSGYLNKLLLRYFKPLQTLEASLILITLFTGLIALPFGFYGSVGVIGFAVMVSSIAWPLCTGVISSRAPPAIQGKILGISQSVQSLAMAIAPVIGGLAYKASLQTTFLVGAGASLLASVLYFTLKNRSS
jgi:DHA1 family tetracycline resistance protein-like MFS transporter